MGDCTTAKWGEKPAPNERTVKISTKRPNKVEASKLPDLKFKTVIIRMFRSLGEEWIKSVRT